MGEKSFEFLSIDRNHPYDSRTGACLPADRFRLSSLPPPFAIITGKIIEVMRIQWAK